MKSVALFAFTAGLTILWGAPGTETSEFWLGLGCLVGIVVVSMFFIESKS